MLPLGLLACLSACMGSSQATSPPAGQAASPARPDVVPTLFGTLLTPATPRVVPLASSPDTAVIPLDASLGAWPGADSHLAGTAHYDRGEWIYEDYPLTAYGAASPAIALLYQSLEAIGSAVNIAQRLPGALGFIVAQTGAGPLVDQADLSELRLAVRDSDLYVLARTTTMPSPARTALLLLFDTGRAGASYAVPFGSGLTTTNADTAALVTVGGTRIVDLASGHTTTAPAAADPAGYNNVLETRLPLALVGKPDGASLRLVAATGLADAGSPQLDPGGGAGPIAKVVPRFGEPVQSVYDRSQALALAAHNIDRFFTTVSLSRMRAGDSEQLLPGIGYSVRTVLAPQAISSEGGSNGILRDYGLYLPRGFSWSPAPATLLLRGSSMTAHSLAAITPGLYQNLGDDNGAVIVSPGGRSDLDQFRGPAYLDALQALDDAEALLPLDHERETVAGYSMGGFATYMFATTQPDRFAGAFVIEGPVGGLQPATSLYLFPDVTPSLANLLHSTVEIYQGDVDADVPITNALAAVAGLNQLAYRYHFNELPANTHFTPGILNDYSIGARYLKQNRRENHPARVVYTRSMAFEQAIDTGSGTDQPGAGKPVGIALSGAWFVHDVRASGAANGVATVDVRTLARPMGAVTPVVTAGLDSGPVGGQTLSPFVDEAWEIGPATDSPGNALQATLTGTAHLSLDLADMSLTAAKPLVANLRTDALTTVRFLLGDPGCVSVSLDGQKQPGQGLAAFVEVTMPPGTHRVDLEPCGG